MELKPIHFRALVATAVVLAPVALIGSFFVARAAPPTTPYAPGETLAPNCAPGSANCTVVAPATAGANTNITSLGGLTTALSVTQGGTGVNASSASNGQLLIGNGTGFSLNTITAGTGITVTNGAGTITIDATGGGAGEANTASNIGTGSRVFKLKSGVDLEFRKLNAASNRIGITENADDISIDVNEANLNIANFSGFIPITQGGTGITTQPTSGQLLIGKSDGTYTVANLTAGPNITITNGDGTITIEAAGGGGGGSGEANTASNVGIGGVGVFNLKSGVDLQFKNINAGSSKISVTSDVPNSEIDIDVSEANLSLNNIGGTLSQTKGGTGLDLTTATNGQLLIGTGAGMSLATITAGSGISITNASGSITIATTGGGGGGEANTASNVGTGVGQFFYQKTGADLEFRGLSPASSKITVVNGTGNAPVTIDVAEANLTLDNLGGTLSVTKGGTGATTAAGAINNLLPSQSGNGGKFLTTDGSNVSWSTSGGGSGEANTASNQGTGTGQFFWQKSGVDLQFRGLSAASTKIAITNGTGNAPVTVDVNEANLSLGSIGGTLNLGSQVTGTLGPTSGGTGITTYATGDTLYASAANTLSKLAIGTTGQVLTVSAGGVPVWQNASSGFTDPMTTRGDIIYRNASNTTVRLGRGTAGQVLKSDGTDIAWATLTNSDVGLSNVENTALSTWAGSTNLTTLGTVTTGTWNATAISPTKGGTGLTSYASGSMLYASAANTLSTLPIGTNGQILSISGGFPTWVAAPGGETNTASNVGVAGVGVFKQKTGVDLEFRNVNAASNKISVTLDAPNNEIDLDVNQANLSLGSIGGTLNLGSQVTGTLGPTSGGTGITTYATGDTLYASAANTLSKLAAGSAGQVLTMSGGVPTWAAVSYTETDPLSVLKATFTTNGDLLYGTGAGTYTRLAAGSNGQILTIAGGVPTWAAASGEANTASNQGTGTGQFFWQKSGVDLQFRGLSAASTKIAITNGTGNAPVTVDVNEANLSLGSIGGTLNLGSQVTGTLGPTSGGTGITSYASGAMIYASAANTLSSLPIGTNGQFLTISGGFPAWAAAPSTSLQSAYNTGATITTASSTPIAFTLTSGGFSATGAGAITLGNNAGTVQVDSTSWDVSTAGVASGFTGFTTTGNVTVSGANITGASPFSFDGSTADAVKTIFAITDPTTTSKTITFPNASGTVAVSASSPITLSALGDIGCATCITTGSTISPTAGGTGITTYATGDILYASAANTLSKLAIGTAGQVLTVAGGVPTWAAATGETNTASNVGTAGVGVFKQKTGVNLEFRTVNAGSNKITVTLDTPNNEIDIDVNQANLALGSIGGTLGLGSQVTGTLGPTNGGTGLTTYASGAMLYASAANTLSSLPIGTNGQFLTISGGFPAWAAAPSSSLQSAYNTGATITTASSTPIAFTLTSGGFSATGAGAITLGNNAGTVQVDSTSWDVSTAGVASGFTGFTTTGNVTVSGANITGASPFSFDGSTADAVKTIFAITDPTTTSKTITFPNASGTVAVSASSPITLSALGDIGCATCITTAATLQSAYNAGATITTAGAVNIAYTLTSGNFNVTGAGAVNLTPTSASQFTSAGALTLTGGAASSWTTSAGALTITSAAAATWGTTAGNLSLQVAGTGTTANVQIGSGAGSGTPDLLVADIKNTAGDPTGTNGAMYYNSNTSKFRCFEAGAWKDCDTSSSSTRLDQIIAATATNTIANANFAQTWNWGTLTTQVGMTLGGGTAMTTGKILSVGTGTYVHTTAETGYLTSLAFTDASTNASGSTSTYAMNIDSTVNTSGAGTKDIGGLKVSAPTLTGCATGACTWDGLEVNTQSTGAASTITQNGLNVVTAGVASGALNGVRIGAITAGAGAETAINIGDGWDQGLTIGVTPSATTGRTIDVKGNWGGNVVVDAQSLTSSSTVTVSTKAVGYLLSNNSGTTNASVTTTFNITGLPETEGTFAFIEIKAEKGVTAGFQVQTVNMQINGTQWATVATANSTAASFLIKNFTVVRMNATWRIIGASGNGSGGNGAGILVKAKTADESVTSSATLQDDDELNFPIGANETWSTFWSIEATAATAQPDIRFAITAPSGAVCDISYSLLNSPSSGAGANVACGVAAINIAIGAGQQIILFITANVTNGSTAGRVTFRWAQNTSNATATQVLTGSFVHAFQNAGADIAETYYSTDRTMNSGDLVALDGTIRAGVKKTTSSYDRQIMGVITTMPGMVLGEGATPAGTRPVHMAIAGRVPVKISMENGPIKAGDALTSSSSPGIAMKATKPGMVIGVALEDADRDGVVSVYLRPQYIPGDSVTATDIAVTHDIDLKGFSILNLKSISAHAWSIDEHGKLIVQDVEIKEGGSLKVSAGKDQMLGEMTIPAGAVKVRVTNASVNADSTIFLTSSRELSQAPAVVEQGAGYFDVALKTAETQDLRIRYLIIQSKWNASSEGVIIQSLAPPSVIAPSSAAAAPVADVWNPFEEAERVASPPAPLFTQQLAFGAKGAPVVALQQRLTKDGYLHMPSTVPFGVYGQYTVDAMRAYQAAHGLVKTGKLDAATMAALNDHAK